MTQSTVRRNPVAVLDGCLERLGGCLTTLAIAGLFLFIGVALSIWGWTVLRNARASANWPVATGVVTSATPGNRE
jgi:hypothetical protein